MRVECTCTFMHKTTSFLQSSEACGYGMIDGHAGEESSQLLLKLGDQGNSDECYRVPPAISVQNTASPPLVSPPDALIRAPPTELQILAHRLQGVEEDYICVWMDWKQRQQQL